MTDTARMDRALLTTCHALLRHGPKLLAPALLSTIDLSAPPTREIIVPLCAVGIAWMVAPIFRPPRGRHEKRN